MKPIRFDPDHSADVQTIRAGFAMREKQVGRGMALGWLGEVERKSACICPGYALAAKHVRGEQFAKSLTISAQESAG